MDNGHGRGGGGGQRRKRRRRSRRKRFDPDSSWVGPASADDPAAVRNEGCENEHQSRWITERLDGTPWRFRKPEEFQWPESVKLTGMETPRDLEFLHYLATAGEIDQTIARIKFGAACRPAMLFLMALGHPIRHERMPGTKVRDRDRWIWMGN